MAELAIALYVSAVEGHHVTRYGTGTAIGTAHDLDAPGNLRWDTEKIVAIPEAEYAAYRREYDGHLAAKELRKRTAEEYAAAQQAPAPTPAEPEPAEPEPAEPEPVSKNERGSFR